MSRSLRLVVVLLLVLVALFSFLARVVCASYVDIGCAEAKQLMESDPDLLILDVRTQEEYETGHIRNSTLIPLAELPNRLRELDKQRETLVYCGVGGRSAQASQILVDNGFSKVYNMLGGITAWIDAGYRIEIVHKGDLVIDETQTFVIKNCFYIQAGNIFVRDYGYLVFRNAEIYMVQTLASSYEILFEDYGILEMKDAILTTDKPLVINFTQNSKAQLNNVNLDTAKLTGLWFDDSSQADIHQAVFPKQSRIWFQTCSNGSIVDSGVYSMSVNWEASVRTSNVTISDRFELELCHRFAHVSVNNLSPGYYEYLDLQEYIEGLQIDLTLNKTLVNEWTVVAYYDSETAISHSVVQLEIWVNDSVSVQLEDLKPAFYSYWNVGQIVLNNTEVTRAPYVVIANSTVRILDSEVFLDLGLNASVYLTNSVVNGLSCNTWKFYGVLYFENATWMDWGSLMVVDADFYMLGNLAFQNVNVVIWQSTNITRNYIVIARDISGGPVAEVNLTLLDKQGTVVWNGLTDSQGLANFNHTFSDSNRTDTLKLSMSKEGFYATEEQVNLSSNTPISVTLAQKPLGDVNEDRFVNILDISLVATSFGSSPTDERWNELCDLNNDDMINIIDITLVAKDYGKTV